MLIKTNAIRRWTVMGALLLLVSPVFPLLARPRADRATALKGSSCLDVEEISEIEKAAQSIQADGLITLRQLAPTLARQERAVAWSALEEAKTIWSRSLELETPISSDECAERPDIRIEFVRQACLSGEPVAGYIRWSQVPDRERVSIVIGMRDHRGVLFSKAAIVSTLAHELGHALGLTDGPASSGVMARIDPENPTTTPSARELQAVHSIRRRAVLPSSVPEAVGGLFKRGTQCP